MAHYHFHVNPGPKGKGADHAQYIAREGRFTEEKYGEIGEKESGNLPEWARGSAARFFAAADEHERANGNAYRELELALPVELSDIERGQLVREFVAEQIGDKHAYAWAIHEPKGHNPHVHLMFSERKLDGIERNREQYFKRANGKTPERGGHLKSDRFTSSRGPEEVVALRARWAEVQNQALARAGVEARVDHRSLEAQGIEREPTQHRGPAVSGVEARGEVAQVSVRREEERAERQQERQEVVAQMREVSREEVAAERVAVRERRELAREAMGEDREAVLTRVEADRREQIERAQAMAERRVERRHGLGEKLLAQARRLRERIGQQLGRVREWVRERFPEPMQQLKERSREVLGAMVGKGRGARAEKTRTSRRERDVGQSAAPPAVRSTTATPAHGKRRDPAVLDAGLFAGLTPKSSAEKAAASELPAAAREPAPRDAATVQHERLASLSAGELKELIARINPPSVERLVELEPAVVGARGEAESHQRTAHQALKAASTAADESHHWRHAHGMQAKLHDLQVVKAAYLVEREAAGIEAERIRVEALRASMLALEELARARREADRRITQETAPARARVAELKQLMTTAYERERVVTEFEQLARDRAAGRAEYQDASQVWQATPPKLRQAIDAYNREPPQVQAAILQRLSKTPALAKSLGEDLKLRREHIREQVRDQGWELGL